MNYKHGHSCNGKRTPIMNTWNDMMRRCYDVNNKRYERYGGRGIIVCNRWHDFNNFLLDMKEKPINMTLDRIDNDGNYCPENCKWSSKKEQARNRSTSKLIYYKCEVKSLAEWCDILNLNYIKTLGRINQCHWSVEKAFSMTNNT